MHWFQDSIDAVVLTGNSLSFQERMLAGPEQARLFTEFETQYSPEVGKKYFHHDEGLSQHK